MVPITLNGTAYSVPPLSSISQLIDSLGYQGQRLAVEYNGSIVPHSQHATTVIEAQARIEIVRAVGGG